MPTPLGTDDTVLAGLSDSASVPPASRLRRGQVVDRYEIVELLGSGGMGEVYRARDVSLGREVALKLVRAVEAEGGACGSLCSLLAREARTLAQLSHPGIVSVHDIGELGGCVYLTMELLRGVTLRTWASEPSRDWRSRLEALLAAGRALVAAHSVRIVHRDVKPDNIFVEDGGRVVVMDFGLARSPADRDAESGYACGCIGANTASFDIDSAIVGTPGFMSPEQAEGRPVDSRTDQFGFAATAWDILHRSPPFRGASMEELLAAVAAHRVEPPPGTTEVPGAVTETLRRALRVSPSARYPNLTALLDQLATSA